MDHPAFWNTTRLDRPFYLTGEYGADILCDVKDAARYVTHLPAHFDCLHWTLVGSALEAVDRHAGKADLVTHATEALAFALEIDGMLQGQKRQETGWIGRKSATRAD
jgi:hypothetical protein